MNDIVLISIIALICIFIIYKLFRIINIYKELMLDKIEYTKESISNCTKNIPSDLVFDKCKETVTQNVVLVDYDDLTDEFKEEFFNDKCPKE